MKITITVQGALLSADIQETSEGFTARITGQKIPMTPRVKPGASTPVLGDDPYQVDIAAGSIEELEKLIRQQIENDIGRVLKIEREN